MKSALPVLRQGVNVYSQGAEPSRGDATGRAGTFRQLAGTATHKKSALPKSRKGVKAAGDNRGQRPLKSVR